MEQRDRPHLGQQERRHLGPELPAGSVDSGRCTLMNMTRNVNVRITFQATQKDKINFFWDEGLTCQDPCDGSVAPWTSRDGWWSGQVHPARLMQVVVDESADERHPARSGPVGEPAALRLLTSPLFRDANQDIPWVNEFGTTVGVDGDGPVLNSDEFRHLWRAVGTDLRRYRRPCRVAEPQRLAPARLDLLCHRQHNAKFGYDGGYFAQTRRNGTGNTRLEYRYDTPPGCSTPRI